MRAREIIAIAALLATVAACLLGEDSSDELDGMGHPPRDAGADVSCDAEGGAS